MNQLAYEHTPGAPELAAFKKLAEALPSIEEVIHLVRDELPPPPPVVLIHNLNERAMTVKLTTKRPTTASRDSEAEKFVQESLGDAGLTANRRLFKDRTNPVRHLLNEINAVYSYHKQHTIPYEDRGPRLLPVDKYETYRDAMRVLVSDIEGALVRLEPGYSLAVAQDIAFRNQPIVTLGGIRTPSVRATVADYPSWDQFRAAVSVDFQFRPLPDASHYLFDVSDEDRAEIAAAQTAVYKAALADLYARISKPLAELVTTLHTPGGQINEVTGKRGGIFRDTKVTNVTEALAQVRSLAMGDEGVIAACDEVAAALPRAIVDNIDVLRESPVVREAAAKRLAEVASRMGGFFGGSNV